MSTYTNISQNDGYLTKCKGSYNLFAEPELTHTFLQFLLRIVQFDNVNYQENYKNKYYTYEYLRIE